MNMHGTKVAWKGFFVCDVIDYLMTMYEGISGLEGRKWACHDFILHNMSVQQKETNALLELVTIDKQ